MSPTPEEQREKRKALFDELGLSISHTIGTPAVDVSKGDGGKPHKWYNITFNVTIKRKDSVVWSGDYRKGLACLDIKRAVKVGWKTINPSESNILTVMSRPNMICHDDPKYLYALQLVVNVCKPQLSLSDVLYCLLLDGAAYFDGMTFEDWCDNCGYDNDSIKAKATYDACDKTGRELVRGIGRDNVAKLVEAFQNY